MMNKLKYFIQSFNWMRVYFSPFAPPIPRFYIGKVGMGTPYFLPRRWVDNKDKPGYMKAVSKTIGFDFVSLGWKTKFDSYRFEWSPIWSFVFFKWQVAVTFVAPEIDHYWECWLYYNNDTDRTKTTNERLYQSMKEYPCTWTTHSSGQEPRTVCYWDVILKDKYKL